MPLSSSEVLVDESCIFPWWALDIHDSCENVKSRTNFGQSGTIRLPARIVSVHGTPTPGEVLPMAAP
eukprot:m.122970 g.122970  ORF g.122970 m.122970 type:complete len:67 (-) comp13441_c0_seq2:1211-1411(-)